MNKWLERTELILGEVEMKRLQQAHVLIVGLGGIGSFAAEFIARSGVGQLTIIDGDVFDITNKNRQLTALDSTIGLNKALEEFVMPERVWEILNEYKPDYVMDCIDSLSPKIEWIAACKRLKIRIISHLGAGGKTDPSKVKVSSLVQSHNCKLGLQVKKRLKKRGIGFKSVRCVFSEEQQQKDSLKMTDGTNFKRSFYGTVSYMPALFGLMGAADVIRYLTSFERKEKT
jgi:tRNA A37 threonylcarbamoyladenosine dehydratase